MNNIIIEVSKKGSIRRVLTTGPATCHIILPNHAKMTDRNHYLYLCDLLYTAGLCEFRKENIEEEQFFTRVKEKHTFKCGLCGVRSGSEETVRETWIPEVYIGDYEIDFICPSCVEAYCRKTPGIEIYGQMSNEIVDVDVDKLPVSIFKTLPEVIQAQILNDIL
jgi:hypothetical protein